MRKQNKLGRTRIGIASGSILIALILLIFYSDITTYIIGFAERNMKKDTQVNSNEILMIRIFVGLVIFLCLSLAGLLFSRLPERFFNFFKSHFKSEKLHKFLLIDDLCAKNRHCLPTLIISIIAGSFFHLYLLFLGQPKQEGLLEEFSTLPFLFAAIVLIIASFHVNKIKPSAFSRRKIILSLLGMAVLLLLIFMEEISWGQRIFGFESFGVFQEKNFQSEVNLHNFFNPFYRILYPLFGMGFFLLLFLILFFMKDKKPYLLDLLVPHGSLFLMVFMLAGASYNGSSEIFEEILAIFFLLYSYRIYMCLRFPKIEFLANE